LSGPEPLRVAVLGAGLMGSAIAAEYAAAGHAVRVTTSPATNARAALDRVGAHLDQLRATGRGGASSEPAGATERGATAPGVAAAPVIDWTSSTAAAADGTDLVVESLPELAALKTAELAAAQAAAPAAILASNTSSLALATLGAGLADPSRLLGTHYLNPPLAFRVVELVQGPATDAAVSERMAAILRGIGKDPILVRRDVPGFVLNRLQFALLREALELVDSGVVAAADLDRLMREGLGRRWSAVGPFGTVALGGPAVFRRVAEELYPVLSRRQDPPARLDRLELDGQALVALRAARDRTLGGDSGRRP
jgi:3-hydroxybutyryl-CoA dehydrogenase